jgi:hypothetical protein
MRRNAGTADVTLKESCDITGTRNLPLKHFSTEQVIINRSEYPFGLVVLPSKGYPEESPATMPLKISSGTSIILRREQDFIDGGVGMFIEI